jgi:hypothetical protein
MPDLNLQDEGSLDNLESSEQLTEEVAPEEGTEKKGGMMTILLVVLAVLIVGGGGAFLLDKLGVVHIFSKKPPQTAMQTPAQQPAETQAAQSNPSETKMLETPPVQGGAAGGNKAVVKSAPPAAKPAQAKQMPAAASGGALKDMKGEYTVQVSAWRDKETADEIVKRLEDAGYPAFTEERQFKDATWFTVRVGRYATRKDAQSAVQNFAEELRSNYWIDKAKAQ